MKKGPEVPQGVVWGILGVVLVGIVIGIFMMMKSSDPPKTDVKTLSPERLEDPDRRGGN